MGETLSAALPADVEELAERLLETACDRGLMLATAESCTGGLVSSILTDVEGKSHAFERGFTTYSEEAKVGMLGIPIHLIREKGAVSREVAIAMANGAISHSRADVALAITGYAGKSRNGEEAGLVHLACVRRGRPAIHHEEHFGEVGRGEVRIGSTRVGLQMMLEALD